MADNTLKANQKNTQPIKVSQTLVIKPPQRSSVGIDKWRSAMQLADRGRRATLIELIQELIDSDPVLGEAIDKRIRAITNSDIVFQIDSKEIEPIMDLIDTTQFEEMLKEIVRAIMFGKTVGEYDFTNGFAYTNIDRRHLNTETKQILINQYDTAGISYENNDFILNVGKDRDLGILIRVIAYAIFKRNGGADYAQFCELFGIPVLAGLYDPDDDNARQEMEQAMAERGSAGSVVMSKNSDLKSIGSEGSGNVTIHESFLNWCDKQILIGIQGQTMTTIDGSSYSQSKVHGDTEDDINKADRRFVQRVLNEKVLPILEKRGYPVKGGWFSFPEKEKALTKTEQLEIAIKVDERTEAGVSEDYFFETFGLPKGNRKNKPEEKEEDDTEPAEEKDQKTASRSAQGKKAQTLKVNDRTFWQKLNDFFANAPR